jgi:hypothetical protein
MRLTSYCSDLLEDAMVLAQTKAINSFNFRDCINTLTELWRHCYEQIAKHDDGFYKKTVKIKEHTILPPCLLSTVLIYSAVGPVGHNRQVYKAAGNNDLRSPLTYKIDGNKLYCRDAAVRNVWLEYIPEPPMLFFTKNNRDPRVLGEVGDLLPDELVKQRNLNYGMFRLINPTGDPNSPISSFDKFVFEHRGGNADNIDITDKVVQDNFTLVSFIMDAPWAFLTYRCNATGFHTSYVIKDLLDYFDINRYNPFDYIGRGSNVEFIRARYNDYTGEGVRLLDHEDGLVKELGWTCDTVFEYPNRIAYNYMVASMAQRFAAMNGSTIMAVEMALVEAQTELAQWIRKDKSAWFRMNNTTGPTPGDML